jgi:dynein heavy chain
MYLLFIVVVLFFFQLTECITKLIAKEMGLKYVTPPAFDIAKSYEDSNCLCPLIFILSPGADPMTAWMILANRMGYSQNCRSISLGQGQVM